MNLNNKNILITGATSGIGLEMAKTYSLLGANIILLGRNQDKLEKIYDEIESNTDTTPFIINCDLEKLDEKNAEEIYIHIKNNYGLLDAIILNAAELGKMTNIVNYDLKTWEKVIKINLTSNFLLVKYLIGTLNMKRDPFIVFTSSSIAKKGRAFWGAYAISKAALESMYQIISDEYKEISNIRFILFNPGATQTQMRSKAYPAEDQSKLKKPVELKDEFLSFFKLEKN